MGVIDFADAYREVLETALLPGETLDGIVAVNHRQSAFKGRLVAIGVTPQRLLIQPVSRRGDPDGAVEAITQDQLASAKMGGAGGGWPTVEAALADEAAVSVVLKTVDGTTWKLMMMHGGGMFGRWGGGEPQQQGVRALAAWLDRSGT